MAEAHIDRHGERAGHDGNDPDGNEARDRRPTILETPPARRKLPLIIAPVVGDAPVESLLDLGQFQDPAFDDPELSLESQAEADVEELQQIDVARRILRRALENLEQPLAARPVVVKRAEQALFAPQAVAAPGRAHDRFIDQGAERVAGGADRLGADTALPRLGLEGSDGSQDIGV